MADDSDVSEITISDDEQTAQGTKAAAAAAAVARVRSLKQQKQQQQQRAAQAQQGYEEGEEDGEAAAGPSTSGGGKGKSGRRGGREGKGRARFADEVEVFGGGEVGYVNGWHEPAGDEGARDDGREDGAVEDESKPLGWSYFRKRDTSEGPVTWEEVDVGELKFVAENLVHSTTQKAASQAGEVMQQIFQAAPGAGDEAAVSDPLGRGYLNLDSMTLGKKPRRPKVQAASTGEKGLKATMRNFRTARLGGKDAAAQKGGDKGDGATGSGKEREEIDEVMRKVMPNQEGFDPESYLATFHADATLPQLEKGLRTLGRELSERTGQLKLLIRNNFERFINCKDAIDDIHSKLRKMLMQGGAGAAGGSGGTAGGRTGSVTAQQQGVGTERVIRQLEQVSKQAHDTFGDILSRASHADRIRNVSGLLQRFHHLFGMPHKITELAARGELEQVVRDYKRANTLIRPTPTSAKVWVDLYAEIEKRVTEVYMAVKQLVTEPPPEGRPMGLDGPVVLLGVAAVAAAGPAAEQELPVAAGGGGMPPADQGQGQQRLQLLPDYLLFMALMQQERLPAARDEDPMRLYVSRLEGHVEERIRELDQQHTDQLGQLVTAWMRATGAAGVAGTTPASAAAAPAGGSPGESTLHSPVGTKRTLHTSLSSVNIRDAASAGREAGAEDGRRRGGAGGRRRGGARGADGANAEDEEGEEEGEEDPENMEEAEEALMLWPGGGTASAFASPPGLPYHIRTELRRLVQDPGGTHGSGHGVLGGGAAAARLAAGLPPEPQVGQGAAAIGAPGGLEEVLPTSAYAPEPHLTAAQRQWVHYLCCVSRLLLWAVPGLWATATSAKYGSNGDLEADGAARAALDRGPSLARRVVEALCGRYAVRLKRTAQSLARAGPMQPGLPLIIKDACHLWVCLSRVGVSRKALATLRDATLAVLAAHVGVLRGHLDGLPEALFAGEDFRLDVLAADQQPVTTMPRRLEEEIGVALLHYQRPLAAVVQAAGGPDEVPSDASWRPMQDAVFHCFSRLSEALAEVGRTVYGDASTNLTPTHNTNPSSGGMGGVSFNLRALTSTGTGLSTAAAGLAVGQQGAPADASGAAAAGGSRHSGSAGGASRTLGGAGPGALADAAAQGRVAQSADVCVLMVISNSAVIRTRVLPGVLKRYRRLLAATAEAHAASQRRLRELTASMRRSNEALGSAYLARKEDTVRAAVAAYLASETAPMLAAAAAAAGVAGPGGAVAAAQSPFAAAGAGAGSGKERALLAGPSGPSPGCYVLLQLLTAVHNEALAYSPSNLRSFMEALAEQLVQQLLQGCRGLVEAAAASGAGGGGGGTGGTGRRGRDRRGAEGAGAAGLQGEGASVEQLVQLVGDLAFLERVLQPLLGSPLQADMQEAQAHLGSAIAVRQSARRYRPASVLAAEVAGLGSDGHAVCEQLLHLLQRDVDAWLQRFALNVRCFAAAAAAGTGAAGAAGASASAGGAGETSYAPSRSGGKGQQSSSRGPAGGPSSSTLSSGSTVSMVSTGLSTPVEQKSRRREQQARKEAGEEVVGPGRFGDREARLSRPRRRQQGEDEAEGPGEDAAGKEPQRQRWQRPPKKHGDELL